MYKKLKGITLIELMTVIAIIGIISSIAWPLFQRYERKVTRGDAIRALHIAANDLEKCASTQGGNFQGCLFTSREIQGNKTPKGKYGLNTTVLNNGSGFRVTATRNAGNDLECPGFRLVINNLGQQGIQSGNNAPIFNTQQVRDCWNK